MDLREARYQPWDDKECSSAAAWGDKYTQTTQLCGGYRSGVTSSCFVSDLFNFQFQVLRISKSRYQINVVIRVTIMRIFILVIACLSLNINYIVLVNMIDYLLPG